MAMSNSMTYEMKLAMKLIHEEKWLPVMCKDFNLSQMQEHAKWCQESFGNMYNDMIMAGKWYGTELPFKTGAIDSKRTFVLIFRDDKLLTMYRMMFPE